MQSAMAFLDEWWPHAAAVLTVGLSFVASGHVLLDKRDNRSAVAWVGLIWLAPVVGTLLYLLLGVNRIHRRAVALRSGRPVIAARSEPAPWVPAPIPATAAHLESLATLVQHLTGRKLTAGNTITPLVDGDAAYPAMIAAIDAAQASVALSTYIFDNDPAGRLFLDALERAVKRGVAVRVLVDAVGARYSWPTPIFSLLRRRRIPAAAFGRTVLPWRVTYFNLRNHRKLLVVDGRVGFTGGMNIRVGHMVALKPRSPVQDLHFRLEGPVVAHLAQIFAEDWGFTRREVLSGDAWFPSLDGTGRVTARGLADGPDEDLDPCRFTRLGALSCARDWVRIVTPYFVPDSDLLTELAITAMRGVRVEIVLPAVNNLLLVHWAATAQLWQVLGRGCRVYYAPPPFDHTKLMLVDGAWALVGSSNWDARSLRLNFEFDVECYDTALVEELDRLVEAKLARARPVTLEDVNGRSLAIRLRDGIARLAAPYL